MTSGGLGATDIGNKGAIGGLSRDFYRRLGKHYGQEEAWTFEPHVAEATFNTIVEEAGIPVSESGLALIPETTVEVTEAGIARQVTRLIEALEDNDDVQEVYSNFELSDELMQVLAGD